MVPLGVVTATSVLVGNAIGRGDSTVARRVAGAGLLCGIAFMTTSALVSSRFRGFSRWATRRRGRRRGGGALIPIAGVLSGVRRAQVVASGILRGAGESRRAAVAKPRRLLGSGLPADVPRDATPDSARADGGGA